MRMINTELLKEVISSRNLINLQRTIQKSVKKHNLNESQLIKLTPQKIHHIASVLNQRKSQFTPKHPANSTKEAHWMREQKKIFSWIIIFYCHIRLVDASQLNQKQLNEIQNIFECKQPMFLRYEIRLMFHVDFQTKPIWTQQESSLLFQINQDFQEETNWKRQSFQLFVRSNGRFYKLPEACRDRWENHLNPKVNKSSWSLEQELKIFQLINKHGMKWSMISKKMGGTRTQHMIKNRFHLIVKKIKSGTRIIRSDQIIEKAIKIITIKISNKKRYCKTTFDKSTAIEEQISNEQICNLSKSCEYERDGKQLKNKQEQSSLVVEDIYQNTQIIASSQPPAPSDYKSMDEILKFNSILSRDTDPKSYLQSFNQCWIEQVQESLSIFDDLLF